jgi:hypothetical protein
VLRQRLEGVELVPESDLVHQVGDAGARRSVLDDGVEAGEAARLLRRQGGHGLQADHPQHLAIHLERGLHPEAARVVEGDPAILLEHARLGDAGLLEVDPNARSFMARVASR